MKVNRPTRGRVRAGLLVKVLRDNGCWFQRKRKVPFRTSCCQDDGVCETGFPLWNKDSTTKITARLLEDVCQDKPRAQGVSHRVRACWD